MPKFTIPTRHSYCPKWQTIDFNTESQNKFVYSRHMALTNGPILHLQDTSVAITINPITIPRGIITCTSHIESCNLQSSYKRIGYKKPSTTY